MLTGRCFTKGDAVSDRVDGFSAAEDISEDGKKIVEAIRGIVQELRNDFAMTITEKDREIGDRKCDVSGCPSLNR